MNPFVKLVLFGMLVVTLEASYQCGIRKHSSTIALVHRGFDAEEGQWPWHTVIVHKQEDNSWGFACGATLLNERHVLTSAHCVVNRQTGRPMKTSMIQLRFGQHNIADDETSAPHLQVRAVGKVIVHPDHSEYLNDIAVLVVRLPVEFTDYVIPICYDLDRRWLKLEGHRGWITGYGTAEVGVTRDVPRTASLPVVSHVQCLQNDPVLFSNILRSQVFCAGDQNGTSPGAGDSGGGMFFSDGDRWVLRGIISFAKVNESTKEVDTSSYVVFVDVQQFLPWVKDVMNENESPLDRQQRRISERECYRFADLAKGQPNGNCPSSKNSHIVSLEWNTSYRDHYCTGVLLNEHYVLTTCSCIRQGESITPPYRLGAQITPVIRSSVIKSICHPQYNYETGKYFDLAICQLYQNITLSEKVIPACLANNWTENLHGKLIRAGFTRDFVDYESFENLYLWESNETDKIDQKECLVHIADSYFAPTTTSGRLCVNNSDRLSNRMAMGSPLQTFNRRTCVYTVQAISTDSIRVNSKSFYIDLYARVADHVAWIEHVVWGAENPLANITTNEGGTWATVMKYASKLKFW